MVSSADLNRAGVGMLIGPQISRNVLEFYGRSNQISREAGDNESEWTMFLSPIIDTAVRSCGHGVYP